MGRLKTTDLMAFDLVRHKKTKEVISVFEIDEYRNVINNEADGYCSETNIGIDDVESIPLTSEILEKIGFYWGYTSSEEDSINNMPKEDIPIPLIMPDKHWCYDNENGGEVTIELPNESDGGLVTVSNNDRRIEFVFDKPICLYELQHLLRLCRLNKLADNLKMEE